MKTKIYLFISLALVLIIAFGLSPVSSRAARLNYPAGANNDGYADLAIGVPHRAVGPTIESGQVHVVYGSSPDGLNYSDTETWDQFDTSDEHPEGYDHFGHALAGGDFNGDGYVDMAIGVPNESVGGVAEAGVVQILYGSSDGVTAMDNQTWSQDDLYSSTGSEAEDHFGQSLTTGDFNGDGYDDLAVGVPDEDFGIDNFGLIDVIYGSPAGLSAADHQNWGQGILWGLEGEAAENERFGYALAVGDFNQDSFHDLVVGVPYDTIDGEENAGAVHIIFGSADGLTADGDLYLYQGDGIQDVPEAQDRFGYSLAVGDFDGNHFDDLAIGVPRESVVLEDSTVVTNAGAVHLLYGSTMGFPDELDQLWKEEYLGTGWASETADQFGLVLAAGDFDNDGRDDLVVGIPYENYSVAPDDFTDAGVVAVMYGSGSGLDGAGTYRLWQAYSAVMDDPENYDKFGYRLAVGDFDGDGYADLVVGVPYENAEDGTLDTGVVHAFYGRATYGLSTVGNQIWEHLDPQENDKFGYTLAALAEPRTLLNRVYLPLTLK